MTSAPSSASIAATVLLPGADAAGEADDRTRRHARASVAQSPAEVEARVAPDAPGSRRRRVMTRACRCDDFEMRVDAAGRQARCPPRRRCRRITGPGRTPVVILAHGAGTDRHHPCAGPDPAGARGRRLADGRVQLPVPGGGHVASRTRSPVLERCWRAVIDAVPAEPRLAPPRHRDRRPLDGRTHRLPRRRRRCRRPTGSSSSASPSIPPVGRAPSAPRICRRITAPMLFVQGTTRRAGAIPPCSPPCCAIMPRRHAARDRRTPTTASGCRAGAAATTPRCARRSSPSSRHGSITSRIEWKPAWRHG